MEDSMRIIAGSKRGHKLFDFSGQDIRPTTDRVKESIFNMLFDSVTDATVLDLFAGSGSLGIETLSNGANSCYFFDNNIKVEDKLKIIINSIFQSVYYISFCCI